MRQAARLEPSHAALNVRAGCFGTVVESRGSAGTRPGPRAAAYPLGHIAPDEALPRAAAGRQFPFDLGGQPAPGPAAPSLGFVHAQPHCGLHARGALQAPEAAQQHALAHLLDIARAAPLRSLQPGSTGVAPPRRLVVATVGDSGEGEVYVGIKGAHQLVRLKDDSGITLQVVAQRSTGEQLNVTGGQVLRPGDKLRFLVNPGAARYLLIGALDASGAFTVYHPFGGTMSATVEGTLRELPGAIELDQVTGAEKLVAVFSQEPVDAKVLQRSMDNAASALPDAKVIGLEFSKASE